MRSKKDCVFCKKKILEIDFKDGAGLQKFLNSWGKIKPSTDTGLCTRHQRRLAEAIKRARYLAVIPYSSR